MQSAYRCLPSPWRCIFPSTALAPLYRRFANSFPKSRNTHLNHNASDVPFTRQYTQYKSDSADDEATKDKLLLQRCNGSNAFSSLHRCCFSVVAVAGPMCTMKDVISPMFSWNLYIHCSRGFPRIHLPNLLRLAQTRRVGLLIPRQNCRGKLYVISVNTEKEGGHCADGLLLLGLVVVQLLLRLLS